jgi:hypothetical protein
MSVSPTNMQALRPMRILLVSDDKKFADRIVSAAARKGLHIARAASEDDLDLATIRHAPNVIVLDARDALRRAVRAATVFAALHRASRSSSSPTGGHARRLGSPPRDKWSSAERLLGEVERVPRPRNVVALSSGLNPTGTMSPRLRQKAAEATSPPQGPRFNNLNTGWPRVPGDRSGRGGDRHNPDFYASVERARPPRDHASLGTSNRRSGLIAFGSRGPLLKPFTRRTLTTWAPRPESAPAPLWGRTPQIH